MRTTGPSTSCSLAVLLSCLVPGGCEMLGIGAPDERKTEAERQAVTRQWRALRDLVQTFAGSVEDCGRRIATASEDLRVKRNSVLYRMRAIEAVRRLLWVERPAEAMVDLWTLCVQLKTYFTEGDGRNEFGAQQHIAVEVTKRLVDHVEHFMAKEIREERFSTVKDRVYQFARSHPITGAYARFALRPSEAPSKERAGLLSWLPSLSLNPLSGVDRSLSEGNRAILAFGRVADRFTDVVAFLPNRVGWRLELLQYDLAESRLLHEATGTISRANASVEEVARTAKALPEQVRKELEKAFQDLDPKLEQVRATLGQVAEASATLDRTGATYDRTAQSVESMAQQLDATLQTFQELVAFLGKGTDEKGRGRDGEPFEILDYDRTARSITAMAEQLQETLTVFQHLVADDRVGARMDAASMEARKTVKTLLWTGGLVLVSTVASILVLLLIYRLVAPRPKASPKPGPLR